MSIPFDRVADRYDDTRGGLVRGAAVAAAMQPWLPPHGPIVEVGVGTGLIAEPLAAAGASVYGVDLSLPMLTRAKKRLPGRLVAGDVYRLPFGDASIAAVYLVHVLHLLPDVRAAFAEVRRVLRPDGRLLTVVVSPHAPDTDTARVLVELSRQLRERRADVPELVIETAEAAGFAFRHREEMVTPAPASPEELAANVESRLWSWSWDLDDDTWQQHVVPAVARLRALPEPERLRPTVDTRALLVFDG